MNLTPSMRQVLTNLHQGQPMWRGVNQFNPGAGSPSTVTALLRHRLIGNDLVSGGHYLTDAGRQLVERNFEVTT